MSESSGVIPGREHTFPAESAFDKLSANLVALASDPKRFVGLSRNVSPQEVMATLENREQVLTAIALRYPGLGLRCDLANGFLDVAKKIKNEAKDSGVVLGTGGIVAGDIDLINGLVTLLKGVSNTYELFGTGPFATPFELDKVTQNTTRGLEKIETEIHQPEAVKAMARVMRGFIVNALRDTLEVYREVPTHEKHAVLAMTNKVEQRHRIEGYFNQHIFEVRNAFSALKR